jgi:hypothetical protein
MSQISAGFISLDNTFNRYSTVWLIELFVLQHSQAFPWEPRQLTLQGMYITMVNNANLTSTGAHQA